MRSGMKGFGGVAISLTLLAAVCAEPQGGGVADESLTSITSDMVNYGMRTFVTAHGVKSGEIKADTAFAYQDSTVVRVKKMEMTVFDEQGNPEATVVADSGRINQATEQMDAWGNVHVKLAGRNCTISSSVIHYDPPLNQIRTDSPVTFEQDGRVTRGSSFSSNLTFDNIMIRFPSGPANICSAGGM
jgi:LPS export ABC transporter protein LptC